jgi:hypothetical protein
VGIGWGTSRLDNESAYPPQIDKMEFGRRSTASLLATGQGRTRGESGREEGAFSERLSVAWRNFLQLDGAGQAGVAGPRSRWMSARRCRLDGTADRFLCSF